MSTSELDDLFNTYLMKLDDAVSELISNLPKCTVAPADKQYLMYWIEERLREVNLDPSRYQHEIEDVVAERVHQREAVP